MRSSVAALVVLTCACGEDRRDPIPMPAAPDGGPITDSGTQPETDESDLLFPRDRLLRVEIEMAAADWDSLRAQTRGWIETLGTPDCLAEPFPSPFTYFPATVTVDGETVERAAVRKKGFLGSLSETKPSLKVSFDEYLPDQELHDLDGLTLNNGRQDPTLIKPCLGYALFREAGLVAPRCNYAEVFVNGERLGVYAHVESIKKRFLRRNFGDDGGQLWEGTLSDFRDGWLGTFEAKNEETAFVGPGDLRALAEAAEAPDATLEAALEAHLDVDELIQFWAAEVFIEHWDGYAGNTNNFYLYQDQGRFRFIPWGLDGILGSQGTGVQPKSVFAQGILARRMYFHPELKQRYLSALRSITDQHGSPQTLISAVDRASAVVLPALTQQESAVVLPALDQLRAFMGNRAADLRAELDAGGGVWTQPLRNTICFETLGDVRATLTTTWGTHPAQNIFTTGTGTFAATLQQIDYQAVSTGASAGLGQNPDDLNDHIFLGAGFLPGGALLVSYVAIEPNLTRIGTLPLNGGEIRGALLRIPQVGQPAELVGFFFGGTIIIRQFSATPGAPVEIQLDTPVIRFPG